MAGRTSNHRHGVLQAHRQGHDERHDLVGAKERREIVVVLLAPRVPPGLQQHRQGHFYSFLNTNPDPVMSGNIIGNPRHHTRYTVRNFGKRGECLTLRFVWPGPSPQNLRPCAECQNASPEGVLW